MTELLDAAAAAAAWGALEASPPSARRHYHHYRPLADAADEFIREAQDLNRIYTGQPEFDAEMRGIGSGHLCVVTGYSHSGKTQWTMKVVRYNKTKRILFLTADETATLLLAKLASIESGIPAKEIEERVAAKDPSAIALLRRIANEEYPYLAVVAKPLTPQVMRESYEEVTSVWGAAPELVIVDYLDLVQAGETVQAKFDFVKAFGITNAVPMLLIHQTSRAGGADGKEITISSGAYGGEQHATYLIGVRRKKAALLAERAELRQRVAKGSEAAADRLADVERDLRVHQYTITINLVKNKRPGGGLVDDFDLEIDRDTGRLYDLQPLDLPSQYLLEVERERDRRRAEAPAAPSRPQWHEQQISYEGEF